MMEIVRTNSRVEFLRRFPKFQKLYEKINKEYQDFCDYVQMCYDYLVKTEPDQAKFIARVKETEFPKVIFDMKSKGVDAREYFAVKYDFGKLLILMKDTKGSTSNPIGLYGPKHEHKIEENR